MKKGMNETNNAKAAGPATQTMKRFRPDDNGVEWGEYGCVAKHPSGKFLVVYWNKHHQSWSRTNRNDGGASHRNLGVVITDNLGGGPVLMTLRQAREECGIEESK